MIDAIDPKRRRAIASSYKSFLVRCWVILLQVGFSLLTIRVLISAALAASPATPVHFIITGGLLLGGLVNLTSALSAFALAIPLLAGLSQAGILAGESPLSLFFSAVWISTLCRPLFCQKAEKPRVFEHPSLTQT